MISKMPLQVWILTLSAFAIGTAEFVIAGILTQVAASWTSDHGLRFGHRDRWADIDAVASAV
jgi:hypothetical protein